MPNATIDCPPRTKLSTRSWLAAGALAVGALMGANDAMAQGNACDALAVGKGQGAFLQPLPYEQDVFSFCKFGYPAHCWVATVPPAWTAVCYPVNPQWIPSYESICPAGVRADKPNREWEGPGSPLQYKGDPNSPNGLATCQHTQ